MLPAILSDDLCSLQENQPRFALAMDVVIDRNGRVVTEIPPRYTNALIRVKKNFVYEEPKLLKNAQYKTIFDISKRMDASIVDSHDVVAHFMVLMNSVVGQYMKTQEIGIFRSAAFIQPTDIDQPIVGLSDETSRIIRSWKNTITQYTTFSQNKNLQHDIMGIDAYVHITSPIRRLVDLLNQIVLSKSAGIVCTLSPAATGFLTEWMGELDYINSTSKSIRKVQMDCELLTKCTNSPEIMDSIHDGIVIEKTGTAANLFSYMVYIEKLKTTTRVKTETDYSLYSKVSCKLYLFQDEDKVRNKIRTTIL
jgi:exoribonuclease R